MAGVAITQTPAVDFDAMIEPFERDLEAVFKDMQEQAFKTLSKGIEEGWNVEKILDEIDNVLGGPVSE